uniref:Uncharacterized protein LOC114343232 n=1 Tax=Diabrotica virgifera virgifera TaxID=50390 RepID=A0A6P7GWQ9_DIAVI
MIVEQIQHKFLRFCAFKLGETIVDHDYSLIENSLKLNTLENRRNQVGLVFLYNLINGNLDCCDLLQCINVDIQTRNRRGDFITFYIPFHRTSYGQNSPIDRYCKLINGKHIEIFNISLNMFKNNLNRVFI